MLETELRRKLAWLIAIRAIVSTILLGSATLIELTAFGTAVVMNYRHTQSLGRTSRASAAKVPDETNA